MIRQKNKWTNHSPLFSQTVCLSRTSCLSKTATQITNQIKPTLLFALPSSPTVLVIILPVEKDKDAIDSENLRNYSISNLIKKALTHIKNICRYVCTCNIQYSFFFASHRTILRRSFRLTALFELRTKSRITGEHNTRKKTVPLLVKTPW